MKKILIVLSMFFFLILAFSCNKNSNEVSIVLDLEDANEQLFNKNTFLSFEKDKKVLSKEFKVSEKYWGELEEKSWSVKVYINGESECELILSADQNLLQLVPSNDKEGIRNMYISSDDQVIYKTDLIEDDEDYDLDFREIWFNFPKNSEYSLISPYMLMYDKLETWEENVDTLVLTIYPTDKGYAGEPRFLELKKNNINGNEYLIFRDYESKKIYSLKILNKKTGKYELVKSSDKISYIDTYYIE